jgi:hypothetical protein
MDYEDAFDIGTIQLEPRLQEYMKRKRFNDENDIEPPIPEEKEFCITSYDLKIIKRYKQGKKKLYSSKRLAKDPHFVTPDAGDFDSDPFNSDFKKDPRYQRLQRKMRSHKEAKKQIQNFEGIDEDYTIFHQSNPYDLKPENRPNKIAKPYDDPNNELGSESEDDPEIYDDQIMMDSRDLVLAPARPVRTTNKIGSRVNMRDEDNDYINNYDPRRSNGKSCNMNSRKCNPNRGKYCYSPNEVSNNPSAYHHPPRIQYRQVVTNEQVSGRMEHSRDLNEIIGSLDNYNKHLNDTYEYIPSEADIDTHTHIPGVKSSSRRENVSSYRAIPFRYGNGLPDVSLEDSLRGGIRDSSKKSIGFRNPFEHQFDYISEDISDPTHTVQMWPQSTRGNDRELARPNSAAVRSDKRIRACDPSKPQGKIRRG